MFSICVCAGTGFPTTYSLGWVLSLLYSQYFREYKLMAGWTTTASPIHQIAINLLLLLLLFQQCLLFCGSSCFLCNQFEPEKAILFLACL